MHGNTIWAGTLSSMAICSGSLFGQCLEHNHSIFKPFKTTHVSPIQESKNSSIRFIDDALNPHFRIEAYYCAAHNTPEERNLLDASIEFWNSQSGKYGYKVLKDGEEQIIPVYFELSEAPGYYSREGFFIPAGHVDYKFLTYLEVIPDERLRRLDKKETDAITVGYTTDQAIFVSEKYAENTTIGMHEMGHSLGATHHRHGIMDPNLLFVKPRVKKKTIRHLLRMAGIPVKGKVKHASKKPPIFSDMYPATGKVVKNKEEANRTLLVFGK